MAKTILGANFLVQQLLDHAESIQPRHLHVEKDHIRIVFLDQVDGFQPVLALRHDIDVVGIFQQVGEFVAGELLSRSLRIMPFIDSGKWREDRLALV